MSAWLRQHGSRMVVLVTILVGYALSAQVILAEGETAWDYVPERGAEGVDHSDLFTDPFTDSHEVTDTCLMCHPDVGESFMQTSHWTWISDEVLLADGTTPTPFGKLNAINNFCVAVAGNWGRCSQCHAGYGWQDTSFDFSNPSNIDCLICHDQSGTYTKSQTDAGYPDEGVDLLAVAQSVGRPTRANCGACHFNGGGGNGVKHGDLDLTLVDCSDETDVHMGVHDFTCQDCHATEEHAISGRLPWLNSNPEDSFSCAKCHGDQPHQVDRINLHCKAVACQTCHIPSFAPEVPTVMFWDWSTAGLDEAPDERVWTTKKGSFELATNVRPEFYWWNGGMDRYLPGQEFDPAAPVELNSLQGGISDLSAKIWPFKVHRGRQPVDAELNTILVPQLFGPDGFWETHDWQSALELGSAAAELPFSGQYDFAETVMYWPINHMVRPKAQVLKCMDCHGQTGWMPWAELGYEGDPMLEGGR